MDKKYLLNSVIRYRGKIILCLLFFGLLYVFVITVYVRNYGNQHLHLSSENADNALSLNQNEEIQISANEDLVEDAQNNETYLPLSADFKYPQDVDISSVLEDYKNRGNTKVKPLFQYSYNFLYSPRQTCSDKSLTVSLLFLIKSATGNLPRRQAIRRTWGNDKHLKTITVHHVFLVGLSRVDMENADIEGEIRTYKDIVRISFFDDYYNNTLKTIGGLKWSTENCNNSKYVIIADDDFYFAPDLLWQHLNTLPKKDYNTLILGKLGQKMVQRVSGGRWYVSVVDWPYDTYPTYIHAGAVVMSWTFARDLYIASMFTKPFKFDDVYLGILCSRLGVKPQGNWNFVIDTNTLLRQYHRFAHTFAAHGFGNPNILTRAWLLHNDIVKVH